MEIKNKLMELIEVEVNAITSLSQTLRTSKARRYGFQASAAMLNGEADDVFKRRIEDKIHKESEVIEDVEAKIAEAEARISAFDESLRILPKTAADGSPKDLRPNSELAKVRDVLLKHGSPLVLDEILQKVGKDPGDERDDKNRRISLRGSLRGYAKKGRIFTIESGIDTFGLLEFKKDKPASP